MVFVKDFLRPFFKSQITFQTCQFSSATFTVAPLDICKSNFHVNEKISKTINEVTGNTLIIWIPATKSHLLKSKGHNTLMFDQFKFIILLSKYYMRENLQNSKHPKFKGKQRRAAKDHKTLKIFYNLIRLLPYGRNVKKS